MTSPRRATDNTRQARRPPTWTVLAVMLGLHVLPGAAVGWALMSAAPGASGATELVSVLGGGGLLIVAETVAAATVLLAARLPWAIAGPLLSCAGVVVARLLLDGLNYIGLGGAALSTPAWNTGTDLVIGLGTLWVMWNTRRMLASRQQLLNDRAERDALTGLLGRTGLSRRLGEATQTRDAALVMFDLNDLKSINDTGGHSSGDSHLRQVAQALEAALPPGGLLGRRRVPGRPAEHHQRGRPDVRRGCCRQRSPYPPQPAALRGGRGPDARRGKDGPRPGRGRSADVRTQSCLTPASTPTGARSTGFGSTGFGSTGRPAGRDEHQRLCFDAGRIYPHA